MKTKFLILPLIALAACSGRPTATISELTVPPTPAATASASVAPPSSPGPAATPDPVAAQRAELLARIEPESVCDELVLEFQLISRDEILDPLNKQKKELQRYVRRVAGEDDLAALDRAIKEKERKPPTLQ